MHTSARAHGHTIAYMSAYARPCMLEVECKAGKQTRAYTYNKRGRKKHAESEADAYTHTAAHALATACARARMHKQTRDSRACAHDPKPSRRR
eukprot:377536-Pleurochrysis_carterae.AAC.1